MNSAARPWIALVFKCLAALALIFAFVFFMRMQDEQSLTDRYRAEGTVSRAIITDKEVDTVRYEGRRGRSRTEEWRMLWVRFDPESTVKYADFPATVSVEQLPGPTELTGDPVADSQGAEIITVPPEVYDSATVGDRLVVVFNGQQTVDIRNDKFKSGPVALQSAGGTIRFRKVSIKPL